ncbi:hypothetical protein GHV55_26405, partial [Pseudomonas aeruginosa]|nr:hypothetical protein [Pseudomonas aeruginosa]
SQTRSFGGHHAGQQGGAEVIERLGQVGAPPRHAAPALPQLAAPPPPRRPRWRVQPSGAGDRTGW